VNKLLRDSDGGALVEFTLVFPILLLAALGTVDFTYMLFDWSMANKAAFIGARTAVVSNPVATEITNPTYDTTLLGLPCSDATTGAATGNCPAAVSTVCTPGASGGSCTAGYSFNDTAFTTILGNMQSVFPRLQRQNVQITYQTNGLGFVGRPGGLPMAVKVSIRPSANPSISCMTHRPYFINSLMGWIFTVPAGCPAGTTAGLPIPTFATTLPSEDMVTN
jgi:Flp pilus assembly protein TadG